MSAASAESRAASRPRSWPAYCCIQQRHSYLRPRPGTTFDPQIAANDDLLDYCASSGITLLAYSPLLGGAYTRSDRTLAEQYVGRDTAARMKLLKTMARELGITPNQLVLARLMQTEPPAIPVMAAGTLEQLRENLGALAVSLTRGQVLALSSAGATA